MAEWARGVAGVAVLSCAALWGQSAANAKPVLVELFTSEGCSDCPPADRLLELLDTKQPVAGVHAIVLSEHVTYWNHDGWTDPFSMDELTERQKEYETRLGVPDSYTPQMVVDGAVQFVGSNGPALQSALEKAATKDALTIENARWENGGASFAVHGSAAGAHLVAVLAADATQSSVARGENAGKTLHHVAVVRVMKDLGANAGDGRALKLAGGSLDHKDETSGRVRLVVFLVDHKTGHVVGVAEETLSRE
ncbi:MAG TPA: DUF1223 domain-containing protein [Terracidiphilus sp.]|nr:DUF1223 domain-containing protein [Terracidiphilus sp.]